MTPPATPNIVQWSPDQNKFSIADIVAFLESRYTASVDALLWVSARERNVRSDIRLFERAHINRIRSYVRTSLTYPFSDSDRNEMIRVFWDDETYVFMVRDFLFSTKTPVSQWDFCRFEFLRGNIHMYFESLLTSDKIDPIYDTYGEYRGRKWFTKLCQEYPELIREITELVQETEWVSWQTRLEGYPDPFYRAYLLMLAYDEVSSNRELLE